MTINLYLDSKSQKPEKGIYVYIRGVAPKQSIVFNSGEYIQPKHWDKTKQQAKRSLQNSMELNSRLQSLKTGVTTAYRECVTENPNADYQTIREAILSYRTPKVKQQTHDVLEAYSEFLSKRASMYSKSSLKKHKSLITHLQLMAGKRKEPLSFDDIDNSFYDNFTHYLLTEAQITNNTVGKYFKLLKTFLNWAYEQGYHTNQLFRKFKTPEEKVDIVYLTEEELFKMYHLDLSDNQRLDKVRDIFCLQCFTGQRYSDISSFHFDDVRDGIWYLRTTKTKDVLKIPITTFALAILEKYKRFGMLPVISTQKMNSYIKEVASLAEVDTPETITRYRGSERIVQKEPKYKFISTHTARRTFVTLSLEKGIRHEVVMRITGHTDYKTFKKYVVITDKVVEQDIRKVWG